MSGRPLIQVFQLRVLILVSLALVSSGCFKHAGDEKFPVLSKTFPITPVYNSVDNSYLLASGSCDGMTGFRFVYYSSLTPENDLSGDCKSNTLNMNLAVKQGDKAQTFTVKIYARLGNKQSAPLTKTINYLPPPPVMPGFAITTAGGISTGSFTVMNSTAGEVVGPATQTSSQAILRTGIQGVLDP